MTQIFRRRLALAASLWQLQHLLRRGLAPAAFLLQFLRRRLALAAFLWQLQHLMRCRLAQAALLWQLRQSVRRIQGLYNRCFIVQCSSGTL